MRTGSELRLHSQLATQSPHLAEVVGGSRGTAVLIRGVETSGQRRDAAVAAAAAARETSAHGTPHQHGHHPGAQLGDRLQPGHKSCHQEGRRVRQPVRVLSGHAPAAQPR